MSRALWMGLTVWFAAASAWGSSASDSAVDSTHFGACSELFERVKESDCVKPVARFLNGATVVLGFSLNSNQMNVTRNDTTVARLDGVLTPAPYYGFSLPKRFFGSTGFGWEVSLLYGSSVSVLQTISRSGKDHLTDLGTYAAVTLAAVSPSIFFALGARDEHPDTYMRVGLGLGLGLGSVRGTAYFTEGPEDGGSTSCSDAATQYVAGDLDKTELKAACTPEAFDQLDFGISSRLFWDWRWHFIYGDIDINGLRLPDAALNLQPVDIALELAYIHDL